MPHSVQFAPSIDHERAWDLGYELLELARSEAYHDVWRIRHRTSYELYAWKQLRPQFENHPQACESLENEAAVGKLVHSPLLMKLIAVHLDDRPRFVIWEWFESRSLEELLQQYVRLAVPSALWIVRQCAEGLAALLQGGLIHSELHPGNILVNPRSGLIKLEGLQNCRRALHRTGFPSGTQQMRPGLSDEPHAVPGHLRGTAHDLYSLGTILYRALAGRLPFTADTPAEIVRGRRVNIADELCKARPEIPQALGNLVADLLATGSSRVLQHPAEVAHRLMEFEVGALRR